MSNEKELSIKLLLDDKEALAKLNTALRKVEGETRKSADSMNLSWAGLASQFYLAQQALGPVVDFMSKAVKAANDQEDAIARLNLALENQGVKSKSVSLAYQEMAGRLQSSTRFADDAILQVQQTLVTFGQVAPQQMERVTTAVLNLATAKRIDLAAAANLVAKAASGQTGALSRYGIIVDENIPKTEKFAEVLQIIEQRMGDAATKDVETFAGAQAKLANAWGDVMEEIGGFITKSPAAKKLMDDLADGASGLAENLAEVQKEKPDLLMDATSRITTFLTKNMGMMAGPYALGRLAGQTLAEQMFGTPEANASKAQEITDATALVTETARLANEQKLSAERAAIEQQAALLFNGEQMKLQSVVQNTEIYKQLKEQETLAFISAEQAKIDAMLRTSNLEATTQQKLLQQKAVLAEAEKKINDAKNKALADAELAKFNLQFEFATATADLTSALATATGSSALKGVSIVLNAVVSAAQAMIAIRAAASPLEAITAGVKLATIAVTAANAFSQISAGEKALEATRNQSIQAVTNVPGLADGGTVLRGGATLVGERGPELLNLPTGSRVTPLDGSGGGRTFHINVTIHNPVFAPGDLTDQLVAQIGPKLSQFLDVEKDRL